MLIKLISFIASFLLLFSSGSPLPDFSDVLVENVPVASESRTAEEINGAKGTKFYIERPVSEALREVNASSFGLSEENEDNFSASSVLGRSL